MIMSLGLDIVETARIERNVSRHGDRFVRRLLGDGEMAVYEKRLDKVLFLSGRFAAKEAVIKALGEYLTDRPPYSSIEILADDNGRPGLSLHETLRDKIGSARCHISISHEEHYAVAVAVFEE